MNEKQKLYSPREIHLALTDKDDEMVVTWITKGRINHPIVYLFKGDCSVVTSNSNNNNNNNNDYDSFNISIGKSIVYNGLEGYVHSVKLNNLEFGKTYCYSVGSGNIYRSDIKGLVEQQTNNNNNNDDYDDLIRWSKWIHFKTKSNEIDHVTFGAFADSGTWGDVHEVVAAMSKDESLSLAIHGGDLSYGLKEDVWDKFGDIIEPLASRMPFMVIPGNWDVKEGALQPFVNRYPMPLVYKQPTIEQKRLSVPSSTSPSQHITLQTNPNLYYSFRYTHVYFIMLSSYDPYTIGSQQYKWLVSELELANSMRQKYPWLIVIAHSPMYSSSTGHGGSDTSVRTQLEWLYDVYNVNLVFSGHDHGYERTHPVLAERVLKKNHNSQYKSKDGTIHILGGTGGATADPWFNEQPNWSAIRESTSGYTKFIAHKQTLQVTYLRMNGTLGDHFQITNEYPTLDSVKLSKVNNNNSTPSEHTGVFLLFFALIVFIFPICAYYKLPHLIFSSLIPKPMISNKSMV
ncbi:hypothetical protein RB653_010421 [Dictyostelium firmibasis]|uniref:Purple acid phosphatase n=1 Tax=Dictyostelium firmibasis TaxID=79012 RepID=A0AAN7YVU3_9MYCE